MKCGRAKWQEAEETTKDFNIVLTRQNKKFFIFELFKVIQDASPETFTTGQCIDSEQFLQVHFIILDVQPIYTPSQTQD